MNGNNFNFQLFIIVLLYDMMKKPWAGCMRNLAGCTCGTCASGEEEREWGGREITDNVFF